ncbi:MAG: DUF1549 domain-containing protein, partial [Planctomycetaceae bacterium]|nr:DUF1549 domain-containing protein [Planctomycetaceae bacterium]
MNNAAHAGLPLETVRSWKSRVAFPLCWLTGLLVGSVNVPLLAADQPAAEQPAGGQNAAAVMLYEKQIRPLLQEKCWACHSALKQQAGLRLDTAALIRAGGEGGPILVPGDAAAGSLLERVMADEDSRMPPAEAGSALTAEQLALLKRWIAAGAPGPVDEPTPADPAQHWSFQPLSQAPAVPAADAPWVRSEIDRFLLTTQQQAGTSAVGEASRSILLRRLYLNLIGLPPTREELHAFVADDSATAWENAVDRLLASPQYGERWARHFMDIWRYSDPSGYGNEIRDGREHVWRWRDWIVESLNADKPYSRMIVEMLAADEAAPGDLDAARATGFLARNWYKFNRDSWLDNTVEHTSKAFLGITANCARCHDHKYDPLGQQEYYELRAIFEPHDVRDDPFSLAAAGTSAGMSEAALLVRTYDAHMDRPTYLFHMGEPNNPDKDHPLSPGVPEVLGGEFALQPVELPVLAWYPALRPENRQQAIAAASKAVEQARAALAAKQQTLETARATLAEATPKKEDSKTPPAGAATDEKKPESSKGKVLFTDSFDTLDEKKWQITSGMWKVADGRLVQSDGATKQVHCVSHLDHPHNFRASTKFRITGGAQYQSVGLGFDVHGLAMNGVYLSVSGQKSQVTLQNSEGGWSYPGTGLASMTVKQGVDYTVEVAVRDQLLNVLIDGQLVTAFTLPASRKAGKLMLYTFSATAEFDEVSLETLPATVELAAAADTPAKEASKGTPPTKEQLAAQVKIAELALAAAERKVQADEAAHQSLVARAAAEAVKYELEQGDFAALALVASRADREAAVKTLQHQLAASQLAVAEADARPATDTKAKQAAAAARKNIETQEKQLQEAEAKLAEESSAYSSLGPQFPRTSTGRRLAFARWITDRQNPLAARVLVNHVWLRHFDAPLVERMFDFGLRSDRPQHADLLDWLAVQFMEDGWSMKQLHRRIALSGAYRLSSSSATATPATLEADPDNHTLWRMNARRMEAEAVRDSVLHLGGSLDPTAGGPPVEYTQGQS